MFEAPRLHTDVHVSPQVAIQMRRHGFDAVSARELLMLSATDEQHLERALSERRAVLTFDRDFMHLHREYSAAGREHWGIIFSSEEDTRTVLRQLLRLFNTLSANELRNQFRWLNDFH